MSSSTKDFGWLLTQLVADSGEARGEGAATAVDWASAMTDFQKRLVIRVLSLMATAEGPGPVRETQLNAISNLFLPPFMTKADVAPLFEIPAATLTVGDVDYLDGFLEALAPFPDGATESG
jgi:hypothetical protein